MTDWTIGQWWLIGLPAPLLIFGDRVEWVGGGTESSNPVVTWLVLLALARTLGCFWRLLHSHNQKTPLSLYFRNSRVLGAGAWNCGGRPNIYLKNHSVYWVSFWDDGRCSRIKQWWSLFNHVNILCCSVAQLCPTLCDPMVYSTPGFPFITISWSLLRLMSIELVMPSNHVILSCPLLLLPSVFTSIRVFSELALCIGWPKYWRFSISPSNEYSGLISFRIDWFDLLVVQGTLKSLLHHHSSKAAILLGLIF